MTEESYIIVYTILLSQNMTQKIRKMSEKNDWRIIYNSIYYPSQSKFDSKNEWET